MKIVKLLQNGNRYLLARVIEPHDNVGLNVDDVYEYVACRNYDPDAPDGEKWDGGTYYRPNSLQSAVDDVLDRVMSQSRLEELATKFKDGLMQDGDVSYAMEYFDEECEMTEEEKEWFGITESEEE